MKSLYLPATDWSILDFFHALAPARYQQLLKEQLLTLLGEGNVVVTNLGRTAIGLALDALRLEKKSKIGIPSIICQTVINTILASGYEPVLIDVESDLHAHIGNELPDDLACVLIPHLYGLSAPIDEWEAWATERGTFLIDDAAQAVGMKYHGRWLGTFGDVGIFSFGPLKNLSVLRGGALFTKKDEIADRAMGGNLPDESIISICQRVLSGVLKYQFGLNIKQFVQAKIKLQKDSKIECQVDSTSEYFSETFQLSHFEAGIVCRALSKMAHTLRRRSAMAESLRIALKRFDCIYPLGPVDNPSWRIPVRISKPMDVSKVVQYFRRNNIAAERIYWPLHFDDKFKNFAYRPLPGAEQCWETTLLLPNPILLGNNGVDTIIDVLARYGDYGPCSMN